MLNSRSRMRGIAAATLLISLAVLACSPLEGLLGAGGPSVEITSPSSGATVEVGELVEVSSTSSAEAGVSRVELLVDGQLAREDEPLSGNPISFALVQPWRPDEAGEVELSVVAYDVDGKASDTATITLEVVLGSAEVEPTPTATPAAEEPGACTLEAALVTDLTVPAGTELAAGSSFVKGWRVENTGTCDWGPGFRLLFASGSQMGGPASLPVPDTAAGAKADLSVELEAPMAPGTHHGEWRLRSDTGQIFGEVLPVEIVVPAAATATPTLPPPTGTPTPPLPTDTPKPSPFIPINPVGPIVITLLPVFVPETEHVSEQVQIASGAIGSAAVSCPSGSVVVSGGYATDYQVLVYTHWKSGNGWRAYAKNNSGSSKMLAVFANCLHTVSAATTTQVGQSAMAPVGDVGHAIAACPAGSVVTGGGWVGKSDGSLWVYNSSKTGNGWQVYARNLSGSPRQVSAYAICLSGVSASVEQITAPTSIAGGGAGNATATCTGGSIVSGGGFASEPDLVMYSTYPYTTGTEQWRTYARNTAGSSRTMHGYAICLSFP
jgi:hypothetical protein